MMTDVLKAFFAAWAEPDTAKRNAMIADSIGGSIHYADPRTDAPITEITALQDYIGQFSQMAPGMPVACVHISQTLQHARATVHFGTGDTAQKGQYVADLDVDGKIIRLIGFSGMGEATG